jgi:hypothetical protein
VQVLQDLPVRLKHARLVVGDTDPAAEVLYERLRLPELVSGEAGEEVVLYLVVEAPYQKSVMGCALTLRLVRTWRWRKSAWLSFSRMGMALWLGAKTETMNRPNNPRWTAKKSTACSGSRNRNSRPK